MNIDEVLHVCRQSALPEALSEFDGAAFARQARGRAKDLRQLVASAGGLALCMGVVGGIPQNAPEPAGISIDLFGGSTLAPSNLLGFNP